MLHHRAVHVGLCSRRHGRFYISQSTQATYQALSDFVSTIFSLEGSDMILVPFLLPWAGLLLLPPPCGLAGPGAPVAGTARRIWSCGKRGGGWTQACITDGSMAAWCSMLRRACHRVCR